MLNTILPGLETTKKLKTFWVTRPLIWLIYSAQKSFPKEINSPMSLKKPHLILLDCACELPHFTLVRWNVPVTSELLCFELGWICPHPEVHSHLNLNPVQGLFSSALTGNLLWPWFNEVFFLFALLLVIHAPSRKLTRTYLVNQFRH